MALSMNNTLRLEAFSDGVFAIAVTLLVFNLKVPDLPKSSPTEAWLWQYLLRQWPAYVGFLSSFLTILIIWINHHYLFRFVQRTDRPLMLTNGLLLLIVTFIPYPTSLLSAYALTPAVSPAAVVFAGTYLALAVAFNLLWYVARQRGLLHQETRGRVNFGGIRRSYQTGPALYALATLLAGFYPFVSILICLFMAVFFAVMSYDAEQ